MQYFENSDSFFYFDVIKPSTQADIQHRFHFSVMILHFDISIYFSQLNTDIMWLLKAWTKSMLDLYLKHVNLNGVWPHVLLYKSVIS